MILVKIRTNHDSDRENSRSVSNTSIQGRGAKWGAGQPAVGEACCCLNGKLLPRTPKTTELFSQFC